MKIVALFIAICILLAGCTPNEQLNPPLEEYVDATESSSTLADINIPQVANFEADFGYHEIPTNSMRKLQTSEPASYTVELISDTEYPNAKIPQIVDDCNEKDWSPVNEYLRHFVLNFYEDIIDDLGGGMLLPAASSSDCTVALKNKNYLSLVFPIVYGGSSTKIVKVQTLNLDLEKEARIHVSDFYRINSFFGESAWQSQYVTKLESASWLSDDFPSYFKNANGGGFFKDADGGWYFTEDGLKNQHFRTSYIQTFYTEDCFCFFVDNKKISEVYESNTSVNPNYLELFKVPYNALDQYTYDSMMEGISTPIISLKELVNASSGAYRVTEIQETGTKTVWTKYPQLQFPEEKQKLEQELNALLKMGLYANEESWEGLTLEAQYSITLQNKRIISVVDYTYFHRESEVIPPYWRMGKTVNFDLLLGREIIPADVFLINEKFIRKVLNPNYMVYPLDQDVKDSIGDTLDWESNASAIYDKMDYFNAPTSELTPNPFRVYFTEDCFGYIIPLTFRTKEGSDAVFEVPYTELEPFMLKE